jgi:hypothetical protein
MIKVVEKFNGDKYFDTEGVQVFKSWKDMNIILFLSQ